MQPLRAEFGEENPWQPYIGRGGWVWSGLEGASQGPLPKGCHGEGKCVKQSREGTCCGLLSTALHAGSGLISCARERQEKESNEALGPCSDLFMDLGSPKATLLPGSCRKAANVEHGGGCEGLDPSSLWAFAKIAFEKGTWETAQLERPGGCLQHLAKALLWPCALWGVCASHSSDGQSFLVPAQRRLCNSTRCRCLSVACSSQLAPRCWHCLEQRSPAARDEAGAGPEEAE